MAQYLVSKWHTNVPYTLILPINVSCFTYILAEFRGFYDDNVLGGNPLPKMPPGSFYKPAFLEFMREEHNACREGVGIIDISSFSKIEITVSQYKGDISGNSYMRRKIFG